MARPTTPGSRRGPLVQGGFSYLFALFAIVLVGLSVMGANTQWKTIMQREREAELLFRGDQYRRAIEAYFHGSAKQYPAEIKDLLKAPQNSKRYLRAAYTDPMTGGPFTPVRCRDRIKGVASSSHAASIKRENFPPSYTQFSAATAYHEWVFQYEPTAPPGQPAPPQPVC